MRPRIVVYYLLFFLFLTACAPTPSPQDATPAASQPLSAEDTSPSSEGTDEEIAGKLVLYSGRSEPLIQPVIDAFKARYPEVEILLKAGSNSEIANILLEEQKNPQADIFITTELFTVQSLSDQGVFQPYLPAGAEKLPSDFLGANNLWTGLTRRARVIMYNTNLVSPEEAPKSILDLTDPRWKGQVAAAGSTNGSLQAQIATMRQLLGEAATEQWLNGLIANEITFFGGHTDVRKAVGASEFKLGLVNHYYYYLQQAEGSPVGIVFPDQGEGQIGLITNASAAAIVKGAANLTAAQAFMDFLVSPDGQKLFAELNYEYPLLPGVQLREGLQPLKDFRLAEVDISRVAQDFNATFDLMENVGLP